MPIAPNNEGVVQNLPTREQADYRRMTQAMAHAEKRNPGMNTEVYTEFLHDWIESAQERGTARQEIINRARQENLPLDRRGVDHQLQEMRSNYVKGFMKNELPRFGKEGAYAWREFGNEMNVSIGGTIGRNFYDKEKGGVQWGGIIGAVALGLVGFNLGNGFGTWMGIAAVAAGILAGGWLGKKAGNMVSDAINGKKKDDNTPATTVQPEQAPEQPAQSQSQHTERSPVSENMERAKRAVLSGDAPSEPAAPEPKAEDLGTFPPQPVGTGQGPEVKR